MLRKADSATRLSPRLGQAKVYLLVSASYITEVVIGIPDGKRSRRRGHLHFRDAVAMRSAELSSILDAARSEIAAGRDPDVQALAAPSTPPAAAPAAPVRPRGRTAFRAQPTITGNMEVRRARSGDGIVLTWDAAAA